MANIFLFLGFHRSGKPRGWLRRTLFRRDKQPRAMFTRVVFKKNGTIRHRFSAWMSSGVAESNAADTAEINPALHGPRSFEETARQWLHRRTPDAPVGPGELESLINAARITDGRLVLALSHDDYTVIPGGLQVCVRREEEQVVARGADYLNVHPFQPLPRLAHFDEDPDPFFNLVLNGKALAISRMSSLIKTVGQIAAKAHQIDVVIHSLLGFHPEQVRELIVAAGQQKCFFWLHDFFSICPGYTLQRNDRAFCNAPPQESNACNICIYGKERRSHFARIEAFFETIDAHVVAPSEVTLAFWKTHSNLPAMATHVAPHVHLDWANREAPLPSKTHRCVTIGHLGALAMHKGWPIFERLFSELGANPDFRFAVLGVQEPSHPEMKWVHVNVTRDNDAAMAKAIAEAEIDIVLHWPNWPETFSLTTHEALEGGAFVVTNAISGNIASTVSATNCGVVLKDEASLMAFFKSGSAIRLAEAARSRRSKMCVSRNLSAISTPLLFGDH